MLVSPTEPSALRSIGTTSSKPEQYGVDFLFPSKLGLVGVQRKEISDLIASAHDGRLARELVLMKRLDIGMLMVEGQIRWTNDGQLLNSQGWSKTQHRGLLWSVQLKGFWIGTSESLVETSELLLNFSRYLDKGNHNSLLTRPKARGDWGSPTDRDFAVHLLQSFPGIGPETAGAIFDTYGVPIKWTITDIDLQLVPGVGKGRAQSLIRALNQEQSTE